MAGVLDFFYNDAMYATQARKTDLVNCINETEAPMFDLIINISYLTNCRGHRIWLNSGTFVIFIVVIAMLCHGWDWIQPVKKWVPESAVLLIIGIIIGAIRRLIISKAALGELHDKTLNPLYISVDWLKFGFLPMVVLNAAYELYHIQFFRQFWDILFLTLVGTVINIIATVVCLKGLNGAAGLPNVPPSPKHSDHSEEISVSWAQFFLLGSALAAVDPVSVLSVFNEINTDTTIYYLLFGESTLNDGVTYALFAGIEKMLHYKPAKDADQSYPAETILYLLLTFVTGPIFAALLAIAMICFSSAITKIAGPLTMDFIPYIVTGFVWWGYYMADRMGFSGIIFIIICAIGQVRYTFPNITHSQRRIILGMIKTNSTVMEIAIFGMMGYDMGIQIDVNSIGYASIVLLIIMVFRTVSVFGLFKIINSWRSERNQVSWQWQVILLIGGLRGALTYIMAKEAYGLNNHKTDKVFMNTLLMIVFLTVLMNGMLIKPLIQKLQLEKKPEKAENFFDIGKILSSSTGIVLRKIGKGTGLISGKPPTKFVLFMRDLDSKFKYWLSKDTESRNSLSREDFVRELNRAYKWLAGNPKYYKSDFETLRSNNVSNNNENIGTVNTKSEMTESV